MHTYVKIYQFAASIGALEGYVYRKGSVEDLDLPALGIWIDNICQGYSHLGDDVRSEFHDDLDRTVGRALHSLMVALGTEHTFVIKLQSIISDTKNMPVSADDFNKTKWFEK